MGQISKEAERTAFHAVGTALGKGTELGEDKTSFERGMSAKGSWTLSLMEADEEKLERKKPGAKTVKSPEAGLRGRDIIVCVVVGLEWGDVETFWQQPGALGLVH